MYVSEQLNVVEREVPNAHRLVPRARHYARFVYIEAMDSVRVAVQRRKAAGGAFGLHLPKLDEPVVRARDHPVAPRFPKRPALHNLIPMRCRKAISVYAPNSALDEESAYLEQS